MRWNRRSRRARSARPMSAARQQCAKRTEPSARRRRPGGGTGGDASEEGRPRGWGRSRRRAADAARLSALGSRLSALGSRLSALGSRLSALGSRLSALGSRLSALGSRLSALGSRLSALGSRLSALGSRLSALGSLNYADAADHTAQHHRTHRRTSRHGIERAGPLACEPFCETPADSGPGPRSAMVERRRVLRNRIFSRGRSVFLRHGQARIVANDRCRPPRITPGPCTATGGHSDTARARTRIAQAHALPWPTSCRPLRRAALRSRFLHAATKIG